MTKLTIEQLDTLLLSRIQAMRTAIKIAERSHTKDRSLDRNHIEHMRTEMEALESVRMMIWQANPNTMLETNYARFE